MLLFLLLLQLLAVISAALAQGTTSDLHTWKESDDGVHRVAFGSCNNAERQGLWGSMLAASPHSLVLLGDNVYADRKIGLYKNYDFVIGSKFLPAQESDFRRQYTLLSQDPQFKALIAHVGGMQGGDGNVRAVYDDHDYGVNNGDRTFENKVNAQRFFLDWLDVPADSPRRTRSGVYNAHTFTVNLPVPVDAEACTEEQHAAGACPAREARATVPFTYKVIMLDGRTHKDPKPGNRVAKRRARDADRSQAFLKDKKGEGALLADPKGYLGDFLGEEQWAWLAGQLLDPTPVDLILLGTGVQVLPEDKILEETWQEFPHARRRLLNALHYARTVAKQAPVVILSGDVHTAEVLSGSWNCDSAAAAAAGGSGGKAEGWADKLWEFTSSGLTHTFVKQTPVRDDIDQPSADEPGKPPNGVGASGGGGGGGGGSSNIGATTSSSGSNSGPDSIFTVMPATLDALPSPEEAAESLAVSLRALELALVELLTPSADSPSGAAPPPLADMPPAGAESEGGTIWEAAAALLEQLQTHAQEQAATQGRVVLELLEELKDAISTSSSASDSSSDNISGSAGASAAKDAGADVEGAGLAAEADDWELWLQAHALDLRAAASAAVDVLENLSLPSAPDTTDEMAAASAIGDALWSLFEDAENFAGNALGDGATYGQGSRDGGEDGQAEAGAGAGASAGNSSSSASKSAAKESTTSAYATYPYPHTQQLSRGKFYEQIYDAFVATGASQAREHTLADHYEGLHYGTVDVRALQPEGGQQGQAFQVEVTMVDHRNRPVIRRTLPPLPLKAAAAAGSVADLMAHWDALPGEPLSATGAACDFVPFHGHTPSWRKVVAKWALIAVPLAGAVGPIAVMMYIVLCVMWETLMWLWTNLMEVEVYMDLQMDSDDEDGGALKRQQLEEKRQQQKEELLQKKQTADDAAPLDARYRQSSAASSPVKLLPVIAEHESGGSGSGEASPRSPRRRGKSPGSPRK